MSFVLKYFFLYKVLANLLETDDTKCKIGSLTIMKEITVHPDIRKAITMMGGVELLIRILSVPNQKLQLLASESIANLAKFKRGRANVRKHQGIPKLGTSLVPPLLVRQDLLDLE